MKNPLLTRKSLRIFTPPNALASRLHDRRGLDIVAAVHAGLAATRALEPQTLGEIECQIQDLDASCTTYRETGGQAAFDGKRVYAAADVIAGLAASVGRRSLGEVASSLCRLIVDDQLARPDAVAVHIEALVVVRQDEQKGPELLEALGRLARKEAATPRSGQALKTRHAG